MLFTDFKKYFFKLFNPSIRTLTNRVTNLETSSTNPKVYRALLSQSGTDAPTAIVLENTLGEVPTFEYVEAGLYRIITVEEIFLPTKTYYSQCVFINQTDDPELFVIRAGIGSTGFGQPHHIFLRATASGVLYDIGIEYTPIEILVYE